MFKPFYRKPGLLVGILAAVGMLTAMACGAAEEPTPTPPTAPGKTPTVATPTPTTIAIAEPTKPPARRGELRVALDTLGSQVMDPIEETRAPFAHYHAPVWDSLVGFDLEKGGIGPGVALRWEINATDPSWTFFLRPGQAFHNGDPLTAADVAFSLRRVSSEESKMGNAATMRKTITDIKVIDDLTVKVFTRGIMVYFPADMSRATFTEGAVMPKKYIEANGVEYFRANPVGSGPWVVTANIKGDRVEYKALEKPHWRGSPSYERLIQFLVPEEATRVAMVSTGEVGLAIIGPPSFREVKGAGLRIVSVPATATFLFQFFGVYYLPELQKSPLADVRVRQALSLAINRQEIIDYVMEGQARWPMPYTMYRTSYDLDVPYWEQWSKEALRYDPTEAKRLLTEAGYPKGFITCFYNNAFAGTSIMLDIGQTLPGYWAKVGVDVNFRTVEAAVFTTMQRGDQKELAGCGAMSRVVERPYGVIRMQSEYGSDGPRHLAGTKAYPTPLSTEFDRLYFAIVEEPDAAKRAKATNEIIRLVSDSWLTIPLVEGMGSWAVNPKLVGEFKGLPGRHELGDVYERIPRPDQRPWPSR